MLRLLLPLLAGALCAWAGPMEKMEQALAEGRFADVIEQAGRRLRKGGVAAELGAACRMAALASNARADLHLADEWLTRAIQKDPDFAGNPALLDDMRENVEIVPGPDADGLLERLRAATAGRPGLRRQLLDVDAALRRTRGDFAGADSLLALQAPLLEWWLGGPYANVAGGGMRRLEAPERGEVDLAAVWGDQQGRPCGWWRVTGEPRAGVDLDMQLGDDANTCAVLLTHVRSDAARDARLLLSGTGRFRVFVNGACLLEAVEVQAGADPLYDLPLRLAAGWNRILLKGCAETEKLAVRVSLTDAAGEPLALESDPDPARWSGPAAALDAPPAGVAAWGPDAWLARWIAAEHGPADQFYLGLFLLKRSFTEEGGRICDEAEAAWPGSFVAERLRIEWLSRRMRDTEASERLQALAKSCPEALMVAAAEPVRLLQENEIDACREVVARMAADFPDSPEAMVYSGMMAMIDGDVAGGLQTIRRAVEIEPGSVAPREALIQMLEASQDEDARQLEQRRLAEARPDYVDALRAVAGEHFRHDQPDEALRWAEASRVASGREDTWYYEAALVEQRAGRFDEALAHIRRGIELFPRREELREVEISLLDKLERPAEALAARRELERYAPFSADLRKQIRLHSGEPTPFDLLPKLDRDALLAEDLGWVEEGAAAVHVIESTEFVVDPDGGYERRYYLLCKALTEAGVEKLRTDGASGEVEIARTIKADGRQIAADVQDGTVAFPELEVGDWTELRLLVAGRPPTGLPGEFWTSWRFQVGNPVLLSRVAFVLPAGMEPAVELHNIELEPARGEAGDRRTLVYEARRLPAILNEPGAVSSLTYAGWLDVSSVRDWSRIVDWYRDVIAGRLEPLPEVRELAARLAEGAADDSTRARRAAHWVMQNVNYEGDIFVNGGYIPRPVRETLRTAYGDCKDQAVLLAGLLRELGLEATVALVNSRSRAARAYLPSTRFTHAIVRAEGGDGQTWWIDPTAEFLSFPNVHVELEGQSALIVDGRGAGFERIPLDPVAARSTTAALTALVGEDGDLEVAGRIDNAGEEAEWLRRFVAREKPEKREQQVNDIVSEDIAGARFKSWSMLAEGLDGPDEIDFDYVLPGAVTSAAGLLLVPPPWSANDVPDNLATLEARATARDLSAWRGRYEERIEFVLPAGRRLIAPIAPVSLECPVGRYRLWSESADEGRLVLARLFEVDSLRVEPADYPAFREMMNAAWKAEKERIVLTTE